MRKIFIDGGANVGQSLEAFCNGQPDIGEYEIFCLEASQDKYNILKPLERKIAKFKDQAKDINFINKAIWIENGVIDFYDTGNESSSITDRPASSDKQISSFMKPISVQSLDLSEWVQENFSKDDHIVLKLDVEGAEYEVFEKLCNSGVIQWFDHIYCEIHGLKVGKTYKDTIRMIDQVNSYGKKLFVWGNIEKYGEKNWTKQEYSKLTVKREFHKWYMRSAKHRTNLPFSLKNLNFIVSKLIDMEQLDTKFDENGKKYRIILHEKKPLIKIMPMDVL